MDQTFILESLSHLKEAAKWLIKKTSGYNYLAFYGELGAGKTTLIQEICKQKGVLQDVTSPTFALVNEYNTDSGGIIYHFDFYRLDSPQEVLDIGLEDYVSSGNPCFMEWPEKIAPFLPIETIKVFIDVKADNSRIIRLDFTGIE